MKSQDTCSRSGDELGNLIGERIPAAGEELDTVSAPIQVKAMIPAPVQV